MFYQRFEPFDSIVTKTRALEVDWVGCRWKISKFFASMPEFNLSKRITFNKLPEIYRESIQAFSESLICIQNCTRLRRATALKRIQKTNNWTRTKFNQFLNIYRAKLRESAADDWWRWSIKSEVKMRDFIKGYHSDPCFSVSFIKKTKTIVYWIKNF